ncbi:sperm acrosome membrane-associated protein 6 [Aulostomus maculatus]
MSPALLFACVSLLFNTSLGCFRCLVLEDDTDVSSRLCESYGRALRAYPGTCFRELERIFDKNPKVVQAGRVGDRKVLQEILYSEIRPLIEDLNGKISNDAMFEERLQTAADNFIAAASKLPNVTDILVAENSRTSMWCDVAFNLPDDIEMIWRFADQVRTQQVDQFTEVTVGVDRLFSIPSTSLQHEGTYQCEIFSGRRSIVRLFYFLKVTPEVVAGHTELQEIFDLSLLPGGRLLPEPGGPPHSSPLLPSPLLISICLTASLLLLFLSLG